MPHLQFTAEEAGALREAAEQLIRRGLKLPEVQPLPPGAVPESKPERKPESGSADAGQARPWTDGDGTV